MPLALDVLVDLARALEEKKQAAGHEDEIAPGEIVAGDAEDRRGQMNDIGYTAEHDDAENKREGQSDAPRRKPLLRRHARHHQRDEDYIVDAEHDLHRAERNE